MPTVTIDGVKQKLDEFGKCPKCGADWCAGDIFETLRAQDWCKNKSDEELRELVESSYSPPYKFSRLVGVELPYSHAQRYDGVSYWECPNCSEQFPRVFS